MTRNDQGQLNQLLQMYLQVRDRLPRFAMLSGVAGVLAALLLPIASTPQYTVDTIALVRPQAVAEPSVAEKEGIGLTEPEPLRVTDYVLLLQSADVIRQVASTYEEQFGENGGFTAPQLSRMLSVTSRLELKTPYAVTYHPTIVMTVKAPDPDVAMNLAKVWAEVARDHIRTITFSAKEERLRYLEGEYTEQRAKTMAVADELNVAKDESNALLDALNVTRADEEEQYEIETIALIQQTSDEWDRKIAEKKAEFNNPVIEAHIAAKTQELSALLETSGQKRRELAEAKATVAALTGVGLDSAGNGGEVDWTIRLEDLGGELSELTVPSRGVNPVSLLITRNLADAQVNVASIPDALSALDEQVGQVRAEISALQETLYENEAELAVLERAQESALSSVQKSREFGIANVQRRSEFEIDNLTRERTAIVYQFSQDLSARIDMLEALAKSHLRSQIAVANTSEEFQIVAAPTLSRAGGGGAWLTGGVAAAALCFMLFTGWAVLGVLIETAKANMASAS